MTDRELLELALKADGRKVFARQQAERDKLVDPATASLWLTDGSTGWNPLTCDADALRLCVKLGMQIDVKSGDRVYVGYGPSMVGRAQRVYETSEDFKGDPSEATRRAIVRAAAAMGKALAA